MFVLRRAKASPKEFISYWRAGYDQSKDKLYYDNIKKPLTPASVRALYWWLRHVLAEAPLCYHMEILRGDDGYISLRLHVAAGMSVYGVVTAPS